MPYQTTQKADEDIIGIYIHSLKFFGQAQAEKYHSGLEKTFALLSGTPGIARERTEFKPPVRLHFHETHVIVYMIRDQDILIVRVLHNRQDWEQHLSC